jgi:hypothetical protein
MQQPSAESAAPAAPAKLSFTYTAVDSAGAPIIGPLHRGDTFILRVEVREDENGAAGIGSVIEDVAFDAARLEPVDYSSDVINAALWDTALTQTFPDEYFLDNLGAFVNGAVVVGDGTNALFAEIPFRVRNDAPAGDAEITGTGPFDFGEEDLIVNSLNDGLELADSDIAFGSTTIAVAMGTPQVKVTFLPRGTRIRDGQTTPVDFGKVRKGACGPTRTFRVSNTGTAPLTLRKLTVPAGYKIVQPLSASLVPGAADTFTVRLLSKAVGKRLGQISFITNDAGVNLFNFPVAGQVTASRAMSAFSAAAMPALPPPDELAAVAPSPQLAGLFRPSGNIARGPEADQDVSVLQWPV